MKENLHPGLIMRLQSGFYAVQVDGQIITCKLRGRLKRRRIQEDIAAVGDRVQVCLLPGDLAEGVIEVIEPRRKSLERLAPTPRGDYRQIMLANPDQVVFVFACAHPEPHLRMLDRFLVIAEKQNIPPLIIANKVDLVGLPRAQEMFADYPPLGYTVIFASAHTGMGIEELRQHLQARISAFAGPSGVGKSSLLNAIQPCLGLAVSKISEMTSKGRHTTVVREMFALDGGGYVADMPGMRSLALYDTEPEELDGYFPELRPLVEKCQFNDCAHIDEPGCAVRKAAENGSISPRRYQSYLNLRLGNED